MNSMRKKVVPVVRHTNEQKTNSICTFNVVIPTLNLGSKLYFEEW